MTEPLPKMVRVNKGRPCPVCKKGDWCLISPTGAACICMRTESGKPCRNGNGWLHKLDEPLPAFNPPPERERPKRGDWFVPASKNMESLEHSRKVELARSLGLPDDGLNCISLLGWRTSDQTFTFPERDGKGNVIGLNRRFPDGKKIHIPGGARGLTLPNGWNDHCKSPLYVVEGPTDTAAMVSAGLKAIGRPSNIGGTKFLVEAMHMIAEDRPIVIVGENDRRRNDDFNRYEWPGLMGAITVAGNLKGTIPHKVLWTLAPTEYKDVRKYLTCEQFESDPWYFRGLTLAGELLARAVNAEFRPDGYSELIQAAMKTFGFDGDRWQF